MNQNITKVKLLKVKGGNGLTLTFDETDKAGAPADGGINYRGLIHQDLKAALQGLAIHYTMLLGYLPFNAVEDIANPDAALGSKAEISGYSLGGDDGASGITITGHFIGPRGRAIITNTPFELFDCAPEGRYVHMDDLIARVRWIEARLDKYLSGEERGEPAKPEPAGLPQGNLFEQDDEKVTKAQIAVPLSDGSGETAKIPAADPEAMKAVKAASNDELGGKKGNGKRKVKQTAQHPSGETEEGAQ